MRKVLALIWMLLIFIGTCSTGIKDVFLRGQISFRLNAHPSWTEIWMLYHNVDSIFILQKIGHFMVYFILVLLIAKTPHRVRGLLITILYAVLTELLQPFFYRDPRILDMLINSMGAILAYIIGPKVFFRKRKVLI